MTLILAILNALAAIPSIAGALESLAQAITLWYVQRLQTTQLQAIADAAALAAHATTEAQRYEASDAWHSALSKPRVSL